MNYYVYACPLPLTVIHMFNLLPASVPALRETVASDKIVTYTRLIPICLDHISTPIPLETTARQF